MSPDPTTVLHSTAIDLSSVLQGKKVAVSGNVTVRNQSGTPISGALVSVTWYRPGGSVVSQSATTNSNGIARFSTTGSRGTYTLTVTDVYKNLYTFDRSGSVLSASIRR